MFREQKDEIPPEEPAAQAQREDEEACAAANVRPSMASSSGAGNGVLGVGEIWQANDEVAVEVLRSPLVDCMPLGGYHHCCRGQGYAESHVSQHAKL